MSIKDRGNIKWKPFLLPEHAEMIEQVFVEDEYIEKPIVDEQQKLENDLVLQTALQNDLEVEITYFKDHHIHTVKGYVLYIDHINGQITLNDINIQVKDVIEVNVIE